MTAMPDEVKPDKAERDGATWDKVKLGFEPNNFGLTPDDLINLLNVYATQFGSYTTLLWQVPALSLTAQSFLLTIALNSTTTNFARILLAVLSMIIVMASWSLMHEKRGHALDHGAVAAKIAGQLQLDNLTVDIEDGVPGSTTAAKIWIEKSSRPSWIAPWIARAGILYGLWRATIAVFFVVDILIIIAAAQGYTWFGHSS
jgi:hypothetical protein